ncbi:hypothetical protein NQL31_002471 [Lotmaria passim]
MIQLDFVLYRFVCNISTFTGLFAEDAEGRGIPDTAAFHCTWSRTPRTRQISPAVSERVGGSTDNSYFKALGSDMALTFTTALHQFHVDGEKEVVTFALRPSQYSVEGALPIIAKGVLDPSPYFDKPKKNYAIKLRDAAGEVTGKLLFSLLVHEIEKEGPQIGSPDRTAGRSPKSPRLNSLEGTRLSLSRNPARDRLFKTSSPQKPSPPPSTPPRASEQRQPSSSVGGNSPNRSSPVAPPPRNNHNNGGKGTIAAPPPPPPPPPSSSARLGASTLTHHIESVDMQLERITVRSEGIDLEHPAPLLLGGDYNLKIRYGSFSYSTTRCVCVNPKEVEYRGQQTCITFQPPPCTEKLRFSLWEDRKQVAGFSLDPAKFTAAPGVWKEYAIPFRYHPTGQKAALDVRVRRLVVPLDGSPVGRHAHTPPSHRQPTMTTGATEPIAFPAKGDIPRRLTYQAEAPLHHHHQQQQQHTPLRSTTSPKKSPPPPPPPPPPQQQNTPSSPPRKGTPLRTSPAARVAATSPLASIVVTHGFLLGNADRNGTPHRFYDASSDRSAHTGLNSGNPANSLVRIGWERTPMQERPPPLTQNLADLPADRRPPDDHESYISEVLARLNRQPRGGGRQHTSLMEEWMGWRDQRERSRRSSAANSVVRSGSVSSMVSRAESLVSVASRRASVPRATKSNADHSLMTPFTPDNSAFRRRRKSPSPAARNPLI